MKITYTFSAIGQCQQTGFRIEARCVFFDGRMSINELLLFDELEAALKQSDTLPDCVVIFSDTSVTADLYSVWTAANDARDRFLARGNRQGLQFVKTYYFVGWDANGYKIHGVATGAQEGAAPWTLPMDEFVRQGVYGLVQNNPVVQLAPAGHVFKHPSGTINKVFVQARELATNEAQVTFIGRAICQALAAKLFAEATDVLIDTMSIYPYVREALDFCGNKARIQSFHSYQSLTEMTAPNTPYVVVISASTTGGMARRLYREQKFDESRILTLIDTSKRGRSGAILAALEDIDERYREPINEGTETEIELVGEHFSSKAKPPRAVTLGINHRPTSLEKILGEFGLTALHPINSTAMGGRASVVSLDGAAVPKSQKFNDWLIHEIAWRVSGAIDVVVHTDDPGSEYIARITADIISANKKDRPVTINYKELMARKLEDANGVLVVTAVAGDGGLLREVSRDLRELTSTDVPRHFLVGVGLPQSAEGWTRLQQFLVRNATTRDYGFSNWLVLPIGPDDSQNAWTDLIKLSGAAQVSLQRPGLVDPKVSDQALAELTKSVYTATQGVLHKSNGHPLAMSEGFLFFGKAFDGRIAEVKEAPTYLAVASVLQTARDIKLASSRLHPTGYESVVLAPENFLRFNDNLLQACLLRAASPAELDYSASPHLSTLMKELLLKVFERHNHAYGAAALEFAAALACGRLRLKQSDVDEVVKKTVDFLKNEPPSALLGFVLMIK